MQFKLPNTAAMSNFERLGSDMGHDVDNGPRRQRHRQRLVTDDENAMLRGAGLPSRRRAPDARPTSTRCAPSATRRSTPRPPPKAALDGHGGGQGQERRGRRPSARSAPTTGRTSAAAGSSIEGTTTRGPVHRARSSTTAPALHGARAGRGLVRRRRHRRSAPGQRSRAYIDPDVTPRDYLYHVPRFRLGDARTTARHAGQRQDRGPQRRRRRGRRQEVGRQRRRRSTPQGFKHDFNTHYVDSQEGYQKMRDLATRVLEHLRGRSTCRTRRTGYQRKAQTMRRLPTPVHAPRSTSRRRPRRGRPGQGGRRSPPRAGATTAATTWHPPIVNPGGAPTSRSSSALTGTKITRQPRHRRHRRDHEHRRAGRRARSTRNAAGLDARHGRAVPHQRGRRRRARRAERRRSATSCSAPATYPRGPQTVKMLRIGKMRDGSKVGVFIYCQEHAREWGTPLVCLETAERLVRNYGTDPETTSARRQPRHLHHPDDQRRRRRRTRCTTPTAAHEPGQLLRVEPGRATTTRRPQQLGRRPQPQLHRRLGLRRLPGRVGHELPQRQLRGPVRALRARGPQRDVGPDDVSEHQVRHQHALQRRLLHVAAGLLHADRASRCRTRRTAR